MIPFYRVNLCLNKSFRLLFSPEILFSKDKLEMSCQWGGIITLHLKSANFKHFLNSKAIFRDTNYSVLF